MRIFSTFLFILLTATAQAQLTAACDLNLGPNPVVCNNAKFTLNPNPVPGDYTWTGSSGLSCTDCPSPVVSGLTTGVYTFIATLTTPDCTASDTLVITVINGEAPQYSISPNREICLGDSVHLGGQQVSGTFYNWFSVPMGFSSFDSDPFGIPLNTTTYYLSVSNGSCPIPMLDSVKITPILLDLLPLTPDSARLCQGRSLLIFFAVNPAGQPLSWSPQTGLQVNSSGTSAVATPQQSTTYTVETTIGGCTRTKQVFIAVDSLPTDLKIRPMDTTICQGAPLLLWSPDIDSTRFPGITHKWTRTPQTTLLTPDSLQNVLVQPNMLTIYRRVTRFGACADSATAVVQVIPAAQLTVVPDSVSMCPGDSAVLKLTYTPGVTNLVWSPPTGLSCATCDSVVVRPAVSTTYTISGKFQNCPVRDTVVVNLKPLAPLHFPDKRSICLGDTVLLNDVFDPSAKYSWTSTHPGFGTDTLPDPRFRPTQTATYFVSTNNGCIGLDSVRIEVNSAILTASKDTTICKNTTTTLMAMTNIPGTAFQWTDALSGQPLGIARVLTVMPVQTTQYVAVFAYADGACQLTDTVTVTVSGEAPALVFPNDLQLCPRETITLNLGPVVQGSEYFWTASPADTTLVFDDENPMVSPAQNTRYIVTATLDNCTVTDTIDIVVYTATLSVTPDTIICAESMVTLTALGSDPNGRYAWDSGDFGASITKSPVDDTNFIVTYTYGDTCTLRDTVFVDVVPTFDLSISSIPDTNALDIGVPVTLFAVVSPPQSLNNFMLVWQETTVDTKTLPYSTESIELVPASNDTSGAFVRYTLRAKSPDGCIKIAEKTFALIFPKVAFPNAFTPDGDGNNDVFRMLVFEGIGYVERMEIFNRWGQLVFESTDPNAAWDGKSKGEPVPSDVYVYRVVWRRGDGALQPMLKGDVTVLR